MFQNKTKIYLVFFVFAVVFGLIFRFAFVPFAKGFREASSSFESGKKIVNLFEQRAKDFDNFKENRGLRENIKDEIRGSFVKKDAPIGFIEFLEEEAKNFNLSIKISVMDIKAEETDFWQPIGFQTFFIGSFSDCLKFLERLERGPFILDVLQINIVRVSEEKIKEKEFEKFRLGDVSMLLAFKVFSGEPPLKKEKK